jgi:hypothetical protein
MRVLEPNLISFLRALPESLQNVLIRPFPGEVEKPFYYLFIIELYMLWGVIIFAIIKSLRTKRFQPGPEATAFFVFTLINLLIIGYTITNTGAIIRYRSIFLPGLGYFFGYQFWANGKDLLHFISGRFPRIAAIFGLVK